MQASKLIWYADLLANQDYFITMQVNPLEIYKNQDGNSTLLQVCWTRQKVKAEIQVWEAANSSFLGATPHNFRSERPQLLRTDTYLAVALDGTSGLTAAGRELGRSCFTQGKGLVAVVAGWVLERSFRFGIELECTLGEEAGPCGDRIWEQSESLSERAYLHYLSSESWNYQMYLASDFQNVTFQ